MQKDSRVVFVHCSHGVSRGGMVMAAYLTQGHDWSRDQALEFLRSRRPGVRPNPAFMELLLSWEQIVQPREEMKRLDSEIALPVELVNP